MSLAIFNLLAWSGECLAEIEKDLFDSSFFQSGSDKVHFNQINRKYHDPSCEWAIKCTRNCIELEQEEALRRKGVPCQVCGGENLHDG
ncbi:MAG: hypothetical protein SFT81_00555 [Candidatus Caenarcaniphilales bacterium]|nr:hypothetical protein [Candidatus Caenarcaniphilales bacterium]